MRRSSGEQDLPSFSSQQSSSSCTDVPRNYHHKGVKRSSTSFLLFLLFLTLDPNSSAGPSRITGATAWIYSPFVGTVVVRTQRRTITNNCWTERRINKHQSRYNPPKQKQPSGVQLTMGPSSSSSSSAEGRVTSTISTTISGAGIPKPRLPIPDPIYSNIPGTWAYDTMSRRVDEEILQRTWEDNRDVWEGNDNDDKNNNKFRSVIDRFNSLRRDLQTSAPLRMLEDVPADRVDDMGVQREWMEWKSILDPFLEKNDTWLTAPWMVTEFYVYRRMIEATGFWDRTSPGYQYDPFAKQKRAGLESSVGSAEPMLGKIPDLPTNSTDGITLAASIALWGNKMDLSLWPADAGNTNVDIFSGILDRAQENLLHDDSAALAAHCEMLRSKGGGNVDIIVDNAGFELITDLALAQYLVDSGIASCVTFQLKSHPTFVSDAMERDLVEHVDHYVNLDKSLYPNAQRSGDKWKEYLRNGQWRCHEDNFWVQPFAMWDMTEPLRTDLKERCDLAFVKGDANYRRLLGDRKWDMTASFDDVVGSYFPCPVCALRTLKAEIGCGMDANQIERARTLDDNWQVNGRFGVVQFGKGTTRAD